MYFHSASNKISEASTEKSLNCLLVLFLLLVLSLSGCALQPKNITVQSPEPVKKKVIVKKKAPVKKKVIVEPTRVAIILSDSKPAYTEIAKAISKKLGDRASLYNLNNDIRRGKPVLDKVRSSDSEQVVAIGLLASQAARTLKNTQVIFCQVFNYEGENLIKIWMKGVSIVPKHDILFSTWKKLDSTIRHVAVITGNKKEALIESAKKQAAKHKIKLTHKVAATDHDFIYTIKHLPDDVQGIWLLQDNRVLSVRAIRETMNYAAKHGKQVVVFTPQLLKLGGLFSSQYRAEDVVSLTLKRLASAAGKKKIPGVDVQMLVGADIRISSETARRLGLQIPADYVKYIHD